MAKKNVKLLKKKEEKATARKILKQFTMPSAKIIEENLKNVDLNDLISGIYLKSSDEDVSYFIKQYEIQLILCMTQEEKFEEGLHDFYLKMSDYIHENKLYKKFYKLCYLVYIKLNTKDIPEDIINAYQNLLMQQAAYFMGTPKKCGYGVDSKGGLMYVDEPGENLTEINYEMGKMMDGKRPYEPLKSLFGKYGYKDVETFPDAEKIINRDQILSNMLYQMAYFITDENSYMISKPYRNPLMSIYFNSVFRTSYDEKKLLDRLSKREFLLPAEGIIIKLANCGEFTEILFEETIIEDSVILLWRAKMHENTYTSGFFDTSSEIFYDAWRDSSARDTVHYVLQNMILQHYLYLTCVLTKEEKEEFYWYVETKDLTKSSDEQIRPLVHYNIKVMTKTEKGEKLEIRHFDRSKYIADLIDINPFLRNLPVGAIASDDATSMARRLGITLPKGKTLVRGFRRKSWHSDKE